MGFKAYTPEQQEAAFWAKVNKAAPGGCWVYTGYTQRFGHGWTRYGLAHRFAWTILRGPIPAGKCLLHHCDNPPCVNPEHLFIGDRTINWQDAKAKGRTTMGERHPHAILTEEKVREIRRLYVKTGPRRSNISALAARFGIAKPTLYSVIRRQTWSHVK